MTPATQSRRAIGNFNGDFDELAAFLNRSWSENKEQPLRYTSDFFRTAFEYPGFSIELAPAIYREGRLAAFVAGFPRTIRIAGQSKRLLFVSFLAIAPEQKRCGYGALMWGELWKRARALGYDGTVNFCIDGDAMNPQMLPLARAFRQPTKWIFGVQYMARFIRADEAAEVTEASQCDAATVLAEAASAISESLPLARVWSPEEAQWQCSRRHNAMTAALCVEGRRGMLSGYAMETSGATPIPCVLVDDILWGDLTPDERGQLAKQFIGRAAKAGARMMITPVLGYADMQPLVAMGFRKTRRLLHAYLTLWDAAPLGSLPAMYIDVF